VAADPGWRHIQHRQPLSLCLARNAGAAKSALHEKGSCRLGALGGARAVFSTYWGDDEDISRDDVLAEICKSVGIDPQKLFAGIGEQAIKDQLKANTDEVMARGGFGSPTIYVDKSDMYFGNDRMPLIHEALRRAKARAA
jgi:2-hydroxychromene-2-carboxylate isomerase